MFPSWIDIPRYIAVDIFRFIVLERFLNGSVTTTKNKIAAILELDRDKVNLAFLKQNSDMSLLLFGIREDTSYVRSIHQSHGSDNFSGKTRGWDIVSYISHSQEWRFFYSFQLINWDQESLKIKGR